MCGITGIVRFNSLVDETEIRSMTKSIAHRGPDGEGVFIKDNIGLGHRRLSIIDIEGGKQPMTSENENLVLTFNGEIYNYKELREELTSNGYKFKTNSDTEVVLVSYQHWDVKCLEKLRGMFAFCIADFNSKKLFLARDHFGIKPLYYRTDSDFFAFSSELKGLYEISGDIVYGDKKSLEYFFQLQYIPAPKTIYKKISKLKPGHFLETNFKGEIIQHNEFNKLKFNNSIGNINFDKKKIILDSVKSHLISDVPFGIFLSGGIDSTLIGFYASKILDKKINAYCIGLGNGYNNEIKIAEKTSKSLGFNFVYEQINEYDLDIFENLIINHFGEPFGDASTIPTYLVSKLAAKDVKMVLTGDGGDEMFAGYYSYFSWHNKSRLKFSSDLLKNKKYYNLSRFLIGSSKKDILNGFSTNHLDEWIRGIQSISFNKYNEVYKNQINNENTPKSFIDAHNQSKYLDRLTYAQYLDIKTYLPYDILKKVDISSMANSLETRPPLIDKEVFKMAAKLTKSEKIKLDSEFHNGKIFLKNILQGNFSEKFINRKKTGFNFSKYYWVNHKTKNGKRIKEKILSFYDLDTYFDRKSLLELWDNGSESAHNLIFLIYVFIV